MVMRYAHLSLAYLSAEVGLLDVPVPPPPLADKASPKRARKGQRPPKRDQAPAKIVEFPRRIGSSGPPSLLRSYGAPKLDSCRERRAQRVDRSLTDRPRATNEREARVSGSSGWT